MVSIRQATPTDAPTIQDVARESWHAAYDDLLGPATVEETIDEWYERPSLETSIDDARNRADAAFLVAEDATDGIVGFVHVIPSREEPSVGSLLRIYVRPRSWGDGVGTALLESLEAAVGPAFDRLRLLVLAENEVGVSFYESNGFERIEARESEFDDLEEYVYEKPI